MTDKERRELVEETDQASQNKRKTRHNSSGKPKACAPNRTQFVSRPLIIARARARDPIRAGHPDSDR